MNASETEAKRVAIRRYELMKEQVEIMRAFCNGHAAANSPALHADYRKEFIRCLDKMYSLYFAAFGQNHPSLY